MLLTCNIWVSCYWVAEFFLVKKRITTWNNYVFSLATNLCTIFIINTYGRILVSTTKLQLWTVLQRLVAYIRHPWMLYVIVTKDQYKAHVKNEYKTLSLIIGYNTNNENSDVNRDLGPKAKDLGVRGHRPTSSLTSNNKLPKMRCKLETLHCLGLPSSELRRLHLIYCYKIVFGKCNFFQFLWIQYSNCY